MKLRERYRKNRRDEIRRNQYIKSQERLRKKVEQEALKAREEKEERERIKEERKELRKKIRQREEAKKARATYILEMSQKADKFYEQKWLMAHFGFIPWKKYIADAKLRMFLAENHCKVYLARLYFRSWVAGVKIMKEETQKKAYRAIATYENSLMSKSFQQWKNIMAIHTKKMQTAEDFRDLHQLEKSFKLWRDYTVMKQIERKQNQITAVNHYDRHIMKHIFERWTRLVKEKDVISGREALKRRLEAKVLCAVPEYVPFSMREH